MLKTDPLWSRVQIRQAYRLSIQNVNTPNARAWVRVLNFSLKSKINIFNLSLQKSNFQWISLSVVNQSRNDLISVVIIIYKQLMESIMENENLLGQRLVLHWLDSDFGPWHSWPPWAGAGLVHVLLRFLPPVPHVLEHSPQEPQDAQLPSTVEMTKQNIMQH